jgi:hypothetical protein
MVQKAPKAPSKMKQAKSKETKSGNPKGAKAAFNKTRTASAPKTKLGGMTQEK